MARWSSAVGPGAHERMRFVFVDRILDLEPSRRILTTKSLPLLDGYLTGRYPGEPLVPASMVIECLAQAGGWLNLVSRDFGVKSVLALVEGFRLYRPLRAGETLLIDVRAVYGHRNGATVPIRMVSC